MHPIDLFRHCPACGAAVPKPGENPLSCPACGFSYFFNPTVAAAAFIFDPAGRVLFIRREKEPEKGKLAVPGGFIDAGETAEEGLRREVREEVGMEIDRIRYLGSGVNHYPYRGVTYPVVDLIYTATTATPDAAQPLDAVAGVEWRQLGDVTADELAFSSVVMGWEQLRNERRA